MNLSKILVLLNDPITIPIIVCLAPKSKPNLLIITGTRTKYHAFWEKKVVGAGYKGVVSLNRGEAPSEIKVNIMKSKYFPH